MSKPVATIIIQLDIVYCKNNLGHNSNQKLRVKKCLSPLQVVSAVPKRPGSRNQLPSDTAVVCARGATPRVLRGEREHRKAARQTQRHQVPRRGQIPAVRKLPVLCKKFINNEKLN